jgi:hypothetical protein
MDPSVETKAPSSTNRLHRWLDHWLLTTDMRRALGLGIFCAAMFVLVNWRGYVQDVVPLAFTPVSICRYGTVNLDAYQDYYDDLPLSSRWPWTRSEYNGHLYSEKSMFVSILVAPFYLPPVLAGVPTESYEFWISWGWLAAAGLTGLTVSISYLTLRRWLEILPATAFSLMLAFGTCLWTIIGQKLYDHQAVLFVATMAWLLHDFPLSPRRAFFAALMAGTAVVLRPACVVLLFPVGLYMLLPGRLAGWRGYVAAFAGVLALPLLMAVANTICFGNWYSTGYPPSEYRDRWSSFWPVGAAGLMIAPNSGLFVQSPFMGLALLGAWVVWFSHEPVRERSVLRAYTLCLLAHWALMAKWHDWQGGLTFTTRMLSEGYPLMMTLVAVGWLRIRAQRWAVPSVACAGVWAVLYELFNLATFDETAKLNTLHLPWTVMDHFFVVHVVNFGVVATVKAVAIHVALFIACAGVLVVAMRPFVLTQPKSVGTAGEGDA